jgi:hypothetical protein
MDSFGDQKLGLLYQIAIKVGKADRAKNCMRRLIRQAAAFMLPANLPIRKGGPGERPAIQGVPEGGRLSSRYKEPLAATTGSPASEQSHGDKTYSG